MANNKQASTQDAYVEIEALDNCSSIVHGSMFLLEILLRCRGHYPVLLKGFNFLIFLVSLFCLVYPFRYLFRLHMLEELQRQVGSPETGLTTFIPCRRHWEDALELVQDSYHLREPILCLRRTMLGMFPRYFHSVHVTTNMYGSKTMSCWLTIFAM